MHVTLPGRDRECGTEFTNFLQRSNHLSLLFFSTGGGTAHSQNVPCRPHATGTNQHQNKQGTNANKIRLRKRPLQRQGTNAEQADHEAANSTAYQQNHYSGHDLTINRPQASRPTPN